MEREPQSFSEEKEMYGEQARELGKKGGEKSEPEIAPKDNHQESEEGDNNG
jgi:hypothetical protein